MVSLLEAEQASKKFAEEEFYNSHIMSVSLEQNKGYELVVYLFKQIRTDNLPQVYEKLKVIYKFMAKASIR